MKRRTISNSHLHANVCRTALSPRDSFSQIDNSMTLSNYYRRALWLPVVVPVLVILMGFLGNRFAGQETPYLELASVLSVPLPGYIPIALWINWKIKRRAFSDADLKMIAQLTPLIIGVVGALVTSLFGSPIQGAFVIALLIIFFGYLYVLIIELCKVAARRVGWLSPTTIRDT